MDRKTLLGLIALISLICMGFFAGWLFRATFGWSMQDRYIPYLLIGTIAIFIGVVVKLQYDLIMQPKEQKSGYEVEEG